jgi:hypothetical protein
VSTSDESGRCEHGRAFCTYPRRVAAGLLLGTALVPIFAGCERAASNPQSLADLVARTEPAGTRVLIVGIDGATFSVIDSLLAEGALPITARLIENGVRAPLRSEAPTISVSV